MKAFIGAQSRSGEFLQSAKEVRFLKDHFVQFPEADSFTGSEDSKETLSSELSKPVTLENPRRLFWEKRQRSSFKGEASLHAFSQFSLRKSANHPGSQDLLPAKSSKNVLSERIEDSECVTGEGMLMNEGSRGSADRAFHFQVDESFEFHAVFHGEFPDQVIDETIYAQAHCLGFIHASLLHVENLLGTYF